MKFIESDHIYVNDDGEVYMGATSLIKRFSIPFDKEKISKKYAKKNKKTVEEVLTEWDKAGKDAIKKGIAFHKMKEDELLLNRIVCVEDEDHMVIPGEWKDGVKVIESLKLEPGVYPELIVWSDKYMVAGQADYVEITRKGNINITDYKTSKEIKKRGYERWDGTTQRMFFPLQNFDDANFNHYSLQINLYAFLIKSHNRNLNIGKLKIEHAIGSYNEEENKFIIEDLVEHKVPDLQKEIKVLLEYYKNN